MVRFLVASAGHCFVGKRKQTPHMKRFKANCCCKVGAAPLCKTSLYLSHLPEAQLQTWGLTQHFWISLSHTCLSGEAAITSLICTCVNTHADSNYDHSARGLQRGKCTRVVCVNGVEVQRADNRLLVWRLQTLCSSADPPAALRRGYDSYRLPATDAGHDK